MAFAEEICAGLTKHIDLLKNDITETNLLDVLVKKGIFNVNEHELITSAGDCDKCGLFIDIVSKQSDEKLSELCSVFEKECPKLTQVLIDDKQKFLTNGLSSVDGTKENMVMNHNLHRESPRSRRSVSQCSCGSMSRRSSVAASSPLSQSLPPLNNTVEMYVEPVVEDASSPFTTPGPFISKLQNQQFKMVFTMLKLNLLRPMFSIFAKSAHNGFGFAYEWAENFEEAMELAEVRKKPIMLIVHRPWCTICDTLKKEFALDDEAIDLSRFFVMVNVNNDDPCAKAFGPDGHYVPRILFFTYDGSLDQELVNDQGNPNYKYFYTNVAHVKHAMKLARNKYFTQTFEDEKDKDTGKVEE